MKYVYRVRVSTLIGCFYLPTKAGCGAPDPERSAVYSPRRFAHKFTREAAHAWVAAHRAWGDTGAHVARTPAYDKTSHQDMALRAVKALEKHAEDPVRCERAWSEFEAMFPGGMGANILTGVALACWGKASLTGQEP